MSNNILEHLRGDGFNENSIIRSLSGMMLWLRHDPESGGIIATDQGGNILSSKEFTEIVDGLNKFFAYYDDGEIEQANTRQRTRRASYVENPVKGPAQPQERKGWIYVVQGSENLYKIGLTVREPNKRLAEFTPKLPFETKLILTIKSNNVVALERNLHLHFANQRVNGEWFELSAQDIEWLRRYPK